MSLMRDAWGIVHVDSDQWIGIICGAVGMDMRRWYVGPPTCLRCISAYSLWRH